MIRVVLASASPARLFTLRRAGVRCEVIVSGVDESTVSAPTPRDLVATLAQMKGHAVLPGLEVGGETVVLACDSMLEFAGRAWGKPGSDAEAVRLLLRIRGGTGRLLTGHYVARLLPGSRRELVRTAETVVRFADLADEEIDAYVATGEPAHVAGGFTIDALGGPFVAQVTGDPHNVVGLSLPLVRVMLADLGVAWPSLWGSPAEGASVSGSASG